MIELPDAQNLVVVEGWLTDQDQQQYVRLTQSNGFLDGTPTVPITDASVVVQTRTGSTFIYSHDGDGYYRSNIDFAGMSGLEYRVRVQLIDGQEIRSEWERMPEIVPLSLLSVESFQENDPDNPNQQITVYYPKISALDPKERENYYRWIFYKNGQIFSEPESITIQDDRFFNGNFIPNNYQEFAYDQGDEMVVQFQSITKDAYEFLKLIKSQITTLGTSSGTTPAIVNGNLYYADDQNAASVLGYFGTIAVSSDTTVVE